MLTGNITLWNNHLQQVFSLIIGFPLSVQLSCFSNEPWTVMMELCNPHHNDLNSQYHESHIRAISFPTVYNRLIRLPSLSECKDRESKISGHKLNKQQLSTDEFSKPITLGISHLFTRLVRCKGMIFASNRKLKLTASYIANVYCQSRDMFYF